MKEELGEFEIHSSSNYPLYSYGGKNTPDALLFALRKYELINMGHSLNFPQ